MSSSPLFLDPIIVPLVVGETVLDVGCGYGRWGSLLRSNFWESPGLKRPPAVDGVDAFQPNVEMCVSSGFYRNVWQQVLPTPLPGKWDTVLACEFIEHLPPEKVDEALDMLEAAAIRRVIISTPNFSNLRPGGETLVGFNDFEAHLSHTSRKAFRRRGYTLLGGGFGGVNLLVRVIKRARFRWEPALQSISRVWPVLGAQLVAYRDVSKS